VSYTNSLKQDSGILNTKKLIKQVAGIQYGAETENAICGERRKSERRQTLNKLAGHMMWGGLRPPHIMDSFSIFSICLVFSALAPYCILCFDRMWYCISGPAGAPNPCFFSFTVCLRVPLSAGHVNRNPCLSS